MLFLSVRSPNWGFQELIFLTIPAIKVQPPSLSLPTPPLRGPDFHLCPVTVVEDGARGIGPGMDWAGREGSICGLGGKEERAGTVRQRPCLPGAVQGGAHRAVVLRKAGSLGAGVGEAGRAPLLLLQGLR